MSKETSIIEFLRAVKKLPTDPIFKMKWIKWLDRYNTPGVYKRQTDRQRSARFVYNHINYPEMLLWLIRSVGVDEALVETAKSAYFKFSNTNQQAAEIRKIAPWNLVELALQKGASKPPTQWLQYWKPFQIKDAISEPWLLNLSAGNQLAKVFPGDTVWIISVEPPGRLITLGPIHVERILYQQKAKTLLDDNVWQASWYIIDSSVDAFEAKYADISSIAPSLRFVSKKSPKIETKRGRVNGIQFQQMRRLAPKSAELISQEWNRAGSYSEWVIDNNNFLELEKLKSLDEKRATKARREQGILRRLLFGSKKTGQCGICGFEYPISLLVVAHIKPRSQCSDLERRDIKHNLMPLCSLGCDSLFEQGFISVKKGNVISGPNKTTTKDLKDKVDALKGLHCNYWSQDSRKYFDWKAKHPPRRNER